MYSQTPNTIQSSKRTASGVPFLCLIMGMLLQKITVPAWIVNLVAIWAPSPRGSFLLVALLFDCMHSSQHVQEGAHACHRLSIWGASLVKLTMILQLEVLVEQEELWGAHGLVGLGYSLVLVVEVRKGIPYYKRTTLQQQACRFSQELY